MTVSAAEDRLVDLREVTKPMRRVAFFAAFDELQTGEALLIVNDHDPMGLFHYLQIAIPGDFTWEYVERGPDEWRVRIGRISS
ncbi:MULTISPECIES: DUF2249 domain-containing protein [Afifella]|uniref:DUF2249 domain-containing protein n=1 Tax=Afifella TaxID=643217 RepID=UPI000FE33095|nr:MULTISPECIES: DUF2249 domain-containing protein [Afifella]MCT8268302.1 DUF2249 domain-containing protein [Afifella sp. JA880]